MHRDAVAHQQARVDQHAGGGAFVQAPVAQFSRAARQADQAASGGRGNAGLVGHDVRLDLGRRVVEVQRREALARRWLHVLGAALVAGVVGNHQLEVGVRVDHLALLVQRQGAARIGQRVDDDGGVLAGLHHFVQVADAAMAHGQGQRAVVPGRAVGIQQVAAHQVGGRHVLVAGQRDQGALERPRHVLHKARLAAARGALEDEGHAVLVGLAVELDLAARGAVEGLFLDAVGRQRVGGLAGRSVQRACGCCRAHLHSSPFRVHGRACPRACRLRRQDAVSGAWAPRAECLRWGIRACLRWCV